VTYALPAPSPCHSYSINCCIIAGLEEFSSHASLPTLIQTVPTIFLLRTINHNAYDLAYYYDAHGAYRSDR